MSASQYALLGFIVGLVTGIVFLASVINWRSRELQRRAMGSNVYGLTHRVRK